MKDLTIILEPHVKKKNEPVGDEAILCHQAVIWFQDFHFVGEGEVIWGGGTFDHSWVGGGEAL